MTPIRQTEEWLPPIAKPPHDPTSWLLNGRVGWRSITPLEDGKLEQVGDSKALALLQEGDSLSDSSGSFGGVVLPTNVAMGPSGELFLLDQQTQTLKRFDPCDCRFVTIPCIGGDGHGARQFHGVHGIAICSGNIFLCDTGHHRVSIFALEGYVLRGHWAPPASAYAPSHPTLTRKWEPYCIAFDHQGRAYVTDRANSCIHRFSPSGRWETCIGGIAHAIALAIDCQDRLYVVAEDSTPSVRVLDMNGAAIGSVSHVKDMRREFPQMGITVDARGFLHLGSLCAPPPSDPCTNIPLKPMPERGVFDLQGNLVLTPPVATPPSFANSGVYVSQALNSELYRCQWHRVILRGTIPVGSTVQVSTHTAEALYPDDQVTGVELRWETNQVAHETHDGEWDCLIRSGLGRYLWIKVEFHSNGKVTPKIESLVIEFPRISLRRYLPAVFGEEPMSADFTDRFLALYDTTLRSIESKIDRLAGYFDPLSAPADRRAVGQGDFLSWLGSWIGVAVDRNWPEAKRRRWIKQAGKLFDLRGTREGLWRQLVLFLELEPDRLCCPDDQPKRRCRPTPYNCERIKTVPCHWQPPPLILEHFKLRRWLFLGAGRLGDQAVLWGKRIVNRSQLNEGAQVDRSQLITTPDPYRDPFHVYAHKFTVFVPASYKQSERGRKALSNLLKSESPAHTAYAVEYVEPRFRIGFQSMIGFDAVVGRYPQGVTLDGTRLGWGSVVSGGPTMAHGPSLRVGKEARVGSTTVIA